MPSIAGEQIALLPIVAHRSDLEIRLPVDAPVQRDVDPQDLFVQHARVDDHRITGCGMGGSCRVSTIKGAALVTVCELT